MKKQKVEIPQTKGLYQGKFGTYYKDPELTIYAGKVVNNKWVDPSPDDIEKQKTSSPTTAAAAKPLAAKKSTQPQTAQQVLAKQAADQRKQAMKSVVKKPVAKKAKKVSSKSNLEVGREIHTKLVKRNLKNKVNTIFSKSVNPDKSLTLEQDIPLTYMHNIQAAFGRTDNNTVVSLKTQEEDEYLKKYAGYYDMSENKLVLDKDHSQPRINLANLSPEEETYFHIATHETLHTSTPRLYNASKEQQDNYFESPTFVCLEEGLTEYIATNIRKSLINKSQGNTQYTFDKKDIYEYHREVNIIDRLVQFGDLDPIEIFQNAKTHEDLVESADKHQRKFLKPELLSAGFDVAVVANYVQIGTKLANKVHELIMCEPRFLDLLDQAKASFQETNTTDSVAHLELNVLFEDNDM